jgi:carbon monoxide dehydrogenase subunit G
MKFRFNVSVEVTKLEVGEIGAKVEGTPLGVVGRLTAVATTRLAEAAADETNVAYSVDATLAGKLGSMGQPVLRSKAKEMEKEFSKRLRAKLGAAS